jgi:hypothetical protein
LRRIHLHDQADGHGRTVRRDARKDPAPHGAGWTGTRHGNWVLVLPSPVARESSEWSLRRTCKTWLGAGQSGGSFPLLDAG